MAGSTQTGSVPQAQGEQNYITGIEEWMRQNPDLMEHAQSGMVDPNIELDVDNPSPWSMRNWTSTGAQPVSDAVDRAAFLRAFSI